MTTGIFLVGHLAMFFGSFRVISTVFTAEFYKKLFFCVREGDLTSNIEVSFEDVQSLAKDEVK